MEMVYSIPSAALRGEFHSRPQNFKLQIIKFMSGSSSALASKNGFRSFLCIITQQASLEGSRRKKMASGITGPKISTVRANPSSELRVGNWFMCPGQR